MPEKTLLSWSGGKDSAFALYELRKTDRYEVVALLTTVTAGYDRISMHGVRRALLEEQAAAVGLPLDTVIITPQADNQEYEDRMRAVLQRHAAAGVRRVAIGDIFLADLRRHREENLARVGLTGVFPLWKMDTAWLARAFIDAGFQAIVTCVDSQQLDGRFCGRAYDRAFLFDLPAGVDPCGENGEFHTFVTDGPIFRRPVRCVRGEIVRREHRFDFCDLVPA